MEIFATRSLKFTTYSILVLLIFISNVTLNHVIAQTDCDNMGFESGDLSEWKASTGCHPQSQIKNWPLWGDMPCHSDAAVSGICCEGPKSDKGNDTPIDVFGARHTMMSTGRDKFGGFELVAPELKGYPKSNFSLRLGNAIVYAEADRVERSFTVDETNAIFAYQFAFVLNDPLTGHGKNELPFFEAGIYDENDKKIDCSYFKILADDPEFEGVDGGKDTINGDITGENMTVRFKDWTPVFISLKDYIGQNLTIRFTNADCARGGHWGYSYITAYCGRYVPMRDTIICADEPVELTSPYPIEGFELEWSTGDTTEVITVTPNQTMTITLKATNRAPFESIGGTCVSNEEVTITVIGSEVAIEDEEICEGETATLAAQPQGVDYEWYTTETGGTPIHVGDTYTTPPLFEDTKYYILSLSDDCPPTSRTEVTVFVKPSPIPEFVPNPPKATIDNPIFTFEDKSKFGVTGTWDFGDGSPVLNYQPGVNPTHSYYATNEGEGPFKYDITLCLQNELGCEKCVAHPIEIMNLWSLYIPNSFTPNGDGINDHFKAFGIGILDFDMRVYNRWGEVVFRSDNLDKGWDGTPISGSNKKQDVYVWKVRAKNNRGKVLKYMGHVSLLQ